MSIKTYKNSKVLSKLCLLHELHGPSSNKKLKGLEHPTTFRARGGQPEERPRNRISMKSLARTLVAGAASASKRFISTSALASSRPWHASRAATCSSSNSCWEELWAVWITWAWDADAPRAVRRPESKNTNLSWERIPMNLASKRKLGRTTHPRPASSLTRG
jgi:hypothetical protein